MVDVAFTLPDLFVSEEVATDKLANKSGNVIDEKETEEEDGMMRPTRRD